jgi:hypothetical protein
VVHRPAGESRARRPTAAFICRAATPSARSLARPRRPDSEIDEWTAIFLTDSSQIGSGGGSAWGALLDDDDDDHDDDGDGDDDDKKIISLSRAPPSWAAGRRSPAIRLAEQIIV